MSYAEAVREQEARMEALGIRPNTEEARSFYRHPDAPQMDGSEERVTWRRHLEQRSKELSDEREVQRRWVEGQQAGSRHGFRDGLSGGGSDDDYDRAAEGHDPDAFDGGYATGIAAGATAREARERGVHYGTPTERRKARRVLEKRYGGSIEVTDAMVTSLLEGLAGL